MPKSFTTVEHAGTGLVIPENLARRIDEMSKGLPKDFTYRRLAKSGEMESLSEGERTDVSYITTDDVDRDGEVVLPGGLDWSRYNRVVTFAHDYKSLPAGSNWWIRSKMKGSRNGLIAKTHYPTKPADWDGPWLPSAVLHLMQQPVPTCTGKSIGFLPLNIRAATAEEKVARPELKDKPIIDKAAGLEYAVAPIPCNGAAEMIAVSKGIESGAFDKSTADVLRKAMEFAGIKDMGDDTLSMPACTNCMSNENVSKKDDGTYACSMCGNPVAPPAEGKDAPVVVPAAEEVKAAKAYMTAEAYRAAMAREVQGMTPELKAAVKQSCIDFITLKRGK